MTYRKSTRETDWNEGGRVLPLDRCPRVVTTGMGRVSRASQSHSQIDETLPIPVTPIWTCAKALAENKPTSDGSAGGD